MRTWEQAKIDYLHEILLCTEYNGTLAAKGAGIARSKLYSWLKMSGINLKQLKIDYKNQKLIEQVRIKRGTQDATQKRQ